MNKMQDKDHQKYPKTEQDLRLSPGLKYSLYATLILVVSYLVLTFVFDNDKLEAEGSYPNESTPLYQQEEAEATGTNRSQTEILAAGEAIFGKICVVCHGKLGEGLVGPNMTDDYWIHGGSFNDLKKVVLDGVIEKGMISYKNQLSDRQIDDVLTYIQSLQGTTPPNAKQPEGKKQHQ